MSPTAPASPQLLLERALAHLKQGQPARAETVLADLRRLYPRQPQVLHFSGIAALQTGRQADAVALLERAVAADPRNAHAHADLGLALTNAGRFADAERQLREALRLRPQFPEAWLNLGNALRAADATESARRAYGNALAQRPDFPEALSNLALVLLTLGRPGEAEAAARRAIALRPDFPEAFQTLGAVLDQLGRRDEAIAAHREGIRLAPRRAQAHADLGKTLFAFGMAAEAEAAYRAALDLSPGRADWQRQLGRLEKGAPLPELEARLAAPGIGDEERMHLGFAIGNAREKSGDLAGAMAALTEANALMRRTFAYDPQSSDEAFAEVEAAFSPEFFARHADAGCPDETPIFVLGMPRSGTTLVEQILASHPDVTGAGELPLLRGLVAGLAREGERLSFPTLLPRLADADFTALGQAYVRQQRAFSASSRFITDKLPGNFLLIGMIRLMLPNARIVHCTRDAADTSLSIFKNWFAGGALRYAYDLREIGHYHRLYQRVMRHWHDVLPGTIHDVSYEAMVADQEGETRKLLAFCRLDFRPETLSFYETSRPVHTASVAQVRQPIGSGSVGIAARYGDLLAPLHRALRGEK